MNLQIFKQKAANISNNPKNRIPDHLLPFVEDSKTMINSHCHIFNEKTVPKAILNLKMPYSNTLIIKLGKFLHRLNSRSNDDKYSKLAYFLETFVKSTKDITDKLCSYYPENTIFTPLMMDMHNRAGDDKRKSSEYFIEEQAKDIKQLLDQKYNLLPFLPIDPTLNDKNGETNVLDVFIKGFTGEYGFMPFGVKIYPSLGYLPGHPLLMEIFRICEEKQIPVTTHCSSGSVHSYKRRIKNIQGWKIGSDGQLTNEPESRWFFGGDAYANYFNHPKNWEPVLKAYPKLRLNFGHFGGEAHWKKLQEGENNTWVSCIMDYFVRFENVYADVSYTHAYPELFNIIKDRIQASELIRNRTLYGSDYYMVVMKGHYRSMKIDFDVAMGDDIIRKIAVENPRKFLF